MLFGVSMLSTEGVIALAVEAEKSYLLLAFPADAFVSLHFING